MVWLTLATLVAMILDEDSTTSRKIIGFRHHKMAGNRVPQTVTSHLAALGILNHDGRSR